MRLIIIESPYRDAEHLLRNVDYARACVHHSLSLGEAPIASHLFYTQPGILNDNNDEEREWGIDAGLAWLRVADATMVYIDHGISDGMREGIRAARKAKVEIIYRRILL